MSHALLQAWRRTLARHGEARAILEANSGRQATFRELAARAAAWRAQHCPAPAAWQGRAVVFSAPNGIGWLEIFLGLLQAGAVAVPLDPAEPPSAQHALAVTLRAAAWWDGARLAPLPGSRRYRDAAVCFIKLTSGTTGRPRALVFTARQLLADARQVTTTMRITARDLNYALIPFGHSYGLGNLALPLLALGVPVVCGASPLPHAIAGDFARWRPTVFPGVPVMWRALAMTAVTLRGLRLAISAGAPLPPEVAQEFAARHGQRIHNLYGSSETGGISYDRSGAATLNGGVGRALRGVRVTPLRGQRLRVESAAVTIYGKRRQRKSVGRWVVPDRVVVAARGELILLGRRGTTVKIAGRRVNLREVIARMRRLPGVTDVWTGVQAGAEALLGAAVATDRTAAELRAALQADTAAWKIPKRLVTLPTLPVTARGKIDAHALRALVFGRV